MSCVRSHSRNAAFPHPPFIPNPPFSPQEANRSTIGICRFFELFPNITVGNGLDRLSGAIKTAPYSIISSSLNSDLSVCLRCHPEEQMRRRMTQIFTVLFNHSRKKELLHVRRSSLCWHYLFSRVDQLSFCRKKTRW